MDQSFRAPQGAAREKKVRLKEKGCPSMLLEAGPNKKRELVNFFKGREN